MTKPSFLPLGCAVLLAVVLAGCGGGGDSSSESTPASTAPTETTTSGAAGTEVPEPAESAEAYAERWATALRERDCETITDIYGYTPDQVPAACNEVAAALKGIEIVGVDQYGPAALIRFKAPGSKTAAIREEAVQPAVALAETDGRFTDAGTLIGVTSFLSESYGGAPRLPEETKQTAERYVEVIRAQDCDALFELELSPEDGKKAQQCKSAFEGSLPPALEEAPDARLEPLGGSGGWSFFGLRAGERYFVIPTLIDSTDGDDIDVVGYFRVEGPPAEG